MKDITSTIWHSMLPAKQTIISKIINETRTSNTHKYTPNTNTWIICKKATKLQIRVEWKMRAISLNAFKTFFNVFRWIAASTSATTNDNSSIAKTIRTYVLYVLMNMCFRQIVLCQMKPMSDEPHVPKATTQNYKNNDFRNWTTSLHHSFVSVFIDLVGYWTMFNVQSFVMIEVFWSVAMCALAGH